MFISDFGMPKMISRPQVGQIDQLPSHEIVKATKIQQSWNQLMHKLLSPCKGVIHHQPTQKPEIPQFDKFPLHQAAILPMLGGMKAKCINFFEIYHS